MNLRLLEATRRPAVRVLAVAIAVVLAAVGCSSDDDGASGGGPDDSIPVVEETDAAEPADAAAPEDDSLEDVNTLEGVSVGLTEVATLDTPIAMATRSGTDDLYVAERAGRVQVLTPDGSGGFVVGDEPLVDISGNVTTGAELGLLGLAFSPDGEHLYLSHSDADANTRLVEYAVDGTTVDPASERELLYLEDEFPNHNGGQITFGPDGDLYYALGDGGGAGDPLQSGQDPTQLFGSILRIDPDGGSGDAEYGVPADNPFADGAEGRPEVYLYGVRNPWRFSFDRTTDDLWVGDVGQNLYEEIDLLPAEDGSGLGANLGWSEMEATHTFDGGSEPADHTPPIFEYGRDGGACSVTGGYVYRGSAIPDLYGAYVYGDYCVSELRGLVQEDGEVLDEASLGASVEPNSLISFGEDGDGELYVLTSTGGVFRIEPA